MKSAAINITLRNIRNLGRDVVFKQYPSNELGEVQYDKEPIEILIFGIYHESSTTRALTTADGGTVYSASTPMLLTEFKSTQNLQRFAECSIGGEMFKVVSIVDIEQSGQIADIVLERVQGNV